MTLEGVRANMAQELTHRDKCIQDWREVYSLDYPDMACVTDKTIQLITRCAHMFRGSVRVSTGRIWTDKARARLQRRSSYRHIRRLQRIFEP